MDIVESCDNNSTAYFIKVCESVFIVTFIFSFYRFVSLKNVIDIFFYTIGIFSTVKFLDVTYFSHCKVPVKYSPKLIDK